MVIKVKGQRPNRIFDSQEDWRILESWLASTSLPTGMGCSAKDKAALTAMVYRSKPTVEGDGKTLNFLETSAIRSLICGER